MKRLLNRKFFYLSVFITLLYSTIATAQKVNEKAMGMAQEGVELIDEGDYEGAISKLEAAKKIDPSTSIFDFEIAYANYKNGNPDKAISILKSLLNKSDATAQYYTFLANIYDQEGKMDTAIYYYNQGIKKYPNDGMLYYEKGNAYLNSKDYGDAVSSYEEGIKNDPTYPGNYYWAAKIYCNSEEEVWGMIYGELFMNLERNTKRTAEISKLLYDTYNKAIVIESDTSMSVSFSKGNVDVSDISDMKNFKLPYGVGVYEPTILMAVINLDDLSINSLDELRTGFLNLYFKNGYNKTYPNVLFDYQKKVQKAGHLSSYNHWVLMKGNENEFSTWYDENKSQFDKFVTWFKSNPINITKQNEFYSAQYN